MLLWAAIALGVAAFLPSSHAATSSPYKVTLMSTSAELDFWPSANGNASLTWNASWTGTPWFQYIRETVPKGMGFHYTTKTGYGNKSNVEGEDVWVGYTFVGSRVEYWGYWAYPGQMGQASVNLTDDKGNLLKVTTGQSGYETNSKAPTMLIDYDFDQVGNYSTCLVPNSGTVVLTHVVATLNISGTPDEIGYAAANPTNIWFSDLVTTGAQSSVIGSKPDAALNVAYTNGNWKQTYTIGAQGNGPEVAYPRIGSTDTNAQMKFNIGTGNIYVRINGTMAWNHGIFEVKVDPAPPGRRPVESYWGFTPWSVINTTYYHTALDPTQNYTFTLTNHNSEGQDPSSIWFEPATLTLWKTDRIKSNSKTNIGAIVGGAVGGVVGAAVIGGLLWFFLRWRIKNSRKVEGRLSPIDGIDGDGDAGYGPSLTPYMSETQPLSAARHSMLTASYPTARSYSTPTESGDTDRTSDYFGGSQYASASAQPQPFAVGSRPVKSVAPPLTVRHPTQAFDAGTLHAVKNPDSEDDMVPPSYNPAWENSSTASLARSGGLGAPQVPQGAHQRNTIILDEPNEVAIIKAQYTRPPQ
ncbi:hypothetical protein CcaverHIS002_0211450 [Cutaneotrichosporon cavernicola]|uniref:Fibronectin type-III domain-containing protein n=1 Tax=Cutaneotrichosporon cavernicola TaxID=279322 RepID=A0AA48L2N9_9TREE|nr:uncharacterized protein CcaverHIS019_0211450 [Cutaneotrichosporon cavernicola]BEI81985.1 hypothetical protein CcaverHIS002_0211450 [Cutaneotrichosporon cavernicola]BEI89783.1 hypothetical protein CcaverHIS019_0211450 [Cutaneotrichosporon cavernicola]